jgi:putative acetyltransferase
MIRPARPDDHAAMARIMAACYRRDFASILDAAALAERDAAHFEGRFANSQGLWVALDETARVVGLFQMTGTHLDLLFVAPDARGAGWGRRLLDHAEELGAATLESFADNAAARRFYESRGWRLAGRHGRPFLGRTLAFVTFARGVGA